MVLAHNGHRGAHCAGELQWDHAHAALAQDAADACTAADAAAAPDGAGESVASGSFYTSAQAVVDGWYAEVDSYRYYGGEPADMAGFDTTWGRFAQLVWVNATRLGCGVSYNCSAGATWVCYYDAAPAEGAYASNVLPATDGCVVSPLPPAPPPADVPPPAPPPLPLNIIDTSGDAISDPDSGTFTDGVSDHVAVVLIILTGLLALALFYVCVCRRHGPF